MKINKIIKAKGNNTIRNMLKSDSDVFANNLNDACTCTGNGCYL